MHRTRRRRRIGDEHEDDSDDDEEGNDEEEEHDDKCKISNGIRARRAMTTISATLKALVDWLTWQEMADRKEARVLVHEGKLSWCLPLSSSTLETQIIPTAVLDVALVVASLAVFVSR